MNTKHQNNCYLGKGVPINKTAFLFTNLLIICVTFIMRWTYFSLISVVILGLVQLYMYGVGATISDFPQSGRNNFPDNLRGLTLIEFYSPNCYHCRKYAPIILRLLRFVQKYLLKTSLRIEQFSCKGGRWCRNLKLQMLPSLRLYQDQVMISELKGRRSYGVVKRWLKHALIMAQIDDWIEGEETEEEDETFMEDNETTEMEDEGVEGSIARGEGTRTVTILPYASPVPSATATNVMNFTSLPGTTVRTMTLSNTQGTPIFTPQADTLSKKGTATLTISSYHMTMGKTATKAMTTPLPTMKSQVVPANP